MTSLENNGNHNDNFDKDKNSKTFTYKIISDTELQRHNFYASETRVTIAQYDVTLSMTTTVIGTQTWLPVHSWRIDGFAAQISLIIGNDVDDLYIIFFIYFFLIFRGGYRVLLTPSSYKSSKGR